MHGGGGGGGGFTILVLKIAYKSGIPFSWCCYFCVHTFGRVAFFNTCTYDVFTNVFKGLADLQCGFYLSYRVGRITENTEVARICFTYFHF